MKLRVTLADEESELKVDKYFAEDVWSKEDVFKDACYFALESLKYGIEEKIKNES